MKRKFTYNEYRNIDLFLWAAIFTVFEFIIRKVTNSTFFAAEAYTVSLAPAIITILYMRWGFYGLIHAGLAGLLFCSFSGGDVNQYMVYIVGNLLSFPAVFILKKIGHEKVRTGRLWFLFPLLVLFLTQTGRILVSVILGNGFIVSLGFYTTEIITDLFTFIIIIIVRRLDGVYENQNHYLLRLHSDDDNEKPGGSGFII